MNNKLPGYDPKKGGQSSVHFGDEKPDYRRKGDVQTSVKVHNPPGGRSNIQFGWYFQFDIDSISSINIDMAIYKYSRIRKALETQKKFVSTIIFENFGLYQLQLPYKKILIIFLFNLYLSPFFKFIVSYCFLELK